MDGETTPELLMLFAMLAETRDRKGVEFCRKHVVGAMRRVMADPPPSNVVTVHAIKSREAHAYFEARRAAAMQLADFCHLCRGCRLARE